MAVSTDATVTYEITNSADNFIEDDSAIWVDYDGVSSINTSINAIRITNDALTPAVVDLSVRTYSI